MADMTGPNSRANLKGVRTVGFLTIIAGIVLMLGGAATWFVVTDQLKAANIVVSDDAWSVSAGKKVNGPIDALAQAQIIDKHALTSTDGKTYAELEQDDPLRDVAMNASFLRASLFTSVVAYGVAAFAGGMGLIFVLIGWSLRRLAP